jgi:hypothetical protein
MNEHHRRGIVFRVLRNAFSCRASKICIAEGSEAKGGNRIWWLSRGSANELSCTSKNVKYLLNK